MSKLKLRIPISPSGIASAMACASLLLIAPSALAQTSGGCVNSPEAETLVLALAGGAVAAWRTWRKRG